MDYVEQVVTSIRNSRMLRLLSVLVLALVLLIPVRMLGQLVRERQARGQGVVDEVSSKWGNAQAITGPALVVPYTYRWTDVLQGGKEVARTETRHAVFLADRLDMRGVIDSEIRKRGIFTVPVFRLNLTVEGEFTRPDMASLGIDPADVAWERAQMGVGISDARAIQEETAVTWNGRQVGFLPGTGTFSQGGTGIHAEVGASNEIETYTFSFPLVLNGSTGVSLTPFARQTLVELRSDYGHPSFQGNWLPIERGMSGNEFRARWSIPFLGRNYPQAWKGESNMSQAIEASRFGVNLVNPVDQYRMADRSVKYAGLFILLTFATIWLIEVLAGVRVHPIQYLMLGGALCLFYLLELSLSEHLGFSMAYTIASVLVIGMVGAYSLVALRHPARALLVGAAVALLYGYLYILLVNEDYALLIGSIGLFLMLAAIMFATRRVDWYGSGTSPSVTRDGR